MLLIVKGIYVACTWKGTSYAVPKAIRVRAANAILGYHLYAIEKLKGIPIFGHVSEDFSIDKLKKIDCALDESGDRVWFAQYLANPEPERSFMQTIGITKASARRIKKMLQRTVKQLEKIA